MLYICLYIYINIHTNIFTELTSRNGGLREEDGRWEWARLQQKTPAG